MGRVRRNKNYLILIWFSIFLFITEILFIGRILYDTNDLLSSTSFVVFGFIVLGSNIIVILTTIYIICMSKNVIKREKSMLLISLFFAWSWIPIFVEVNAYLKSGLSKVNYNLAIDYLDTTNVEQILKQEGVKNAIDKNKVLKRQIKNITSFWKNKVEDEHDAKSVIIKLLKNHGIQYKNEYEPDLILKLGQSLFKA